MEAVGTVKALVPTGRAALRTVGQEVGRSRLAGAVALVMGTEAAKGVRLRVAAVGPRREEGPEHLRRAARVRAPASVPGPALVRREVRERGPAGRDRWRHEQARPLAGPTRRTARHRAPHHTGQGLAGVCRREAPAAPAEVRAAARVGAGDQAPAGAQEAENGAGKSSRLKPPPPTSLRMPRCPRARSSWSAAPPRRS